MIWMKLRVPSPNFLYYDRDPDTVHGTYLIDGPRCIVGIPHQYNNRRNIYFFDSEPLPFLNELHGTIVPPNLFPHSYRPLVLVTRHHDPKTRDPNMGIGTLHGTFTSDQTI